MSTVRVATSTVTQPVGSQAKPSVLTRAALAIRQLQFTGDDLKESSRLYRVLNDLHSAVSSALQSLASNPTLSGVLLSGEVFTGGQTRTLTHGLGRAFRGWYVVRAQGGVAAFVEAGLPAGMTPTQGLSLTSTNAGTFDLFVF